MSAKIYQFVTERIIKQLEAGTIPWVRPWNTAKPKNLVTKKEYRGINRFMLSTVPSEYFLTFNQAKKLEGKVKKGAESYPVVFWKFLEVESKLNPDKLDKIPLLRYYSIFAATDVEGIEDKIPQSETGTIDSIAAAEEIVENMPNRPEIVHGGSRAYYSPRKDIVGMPQRNDFLTAEHYYISLFHELIHSTGHSARLDRDPVNNHGGFGRESYSKEELIAEMGSAFLSSTANIETIKTIENTAAYIKGWLKALKDDTKLLITAAGKAQKAADYITNKQESF